LYSHVVDSLDLFCYVCLLSLTILTMWAFKWELDPILRLWITTPSL
jgi:hypothetical protein